MPFTSAAWDGSAGRYRDTAAYCAACLINLNRGGEETQANCKLPIREPSGTYNTNAMAAAAAALAGARGGVEAPPDAKRAAARRLMRLYHEAQREPPEMLRRMAGMA